MRPSDSSFPPPFPGAGASEQFASQVAGAGCGDSVVTADQNNREPFPDSVRAAPASSLSPLMTVRCASRPMPTGAVSETASDLPSSPPFNSPPTIIQGKSRESPDQSWQDRAFHSDPTPTTSVRDFIENASSRFDNKYIPPDPIKRDINDSLHIEHYSVSPLWLGQSQRKGLSQFIPSDLPPVAHVDAAMVLPFPLSAGMPLPLDLKRAIDFAAFSDPESLIKFWASQVASLRSLGARLDPLRAKWLDLSPPEIRQVSARLHLPLLKFVLHAFDMGGEEWVDSFIFGFPMVGLHSQKGVFPAEARSAFDPQENILAGVTSRFRSRVTDSCPSNGEALWNEALAQSREGWLEGPWSLSSDGFVESGPSPFPNNINHAFRFGVVQGEKIRACDDLKANGVNSATHITTPITLPSWGHIASSVLRFQHFNPSASLSLIKADHEAAYKQLPLDPSEAGLAAVTLLNPTSNSWCAFLPRTLIFGSTSAVLHYNCLSRIVASLCCRILGIPRLGYFDDFGMIIYSSLERATLQAFVGLNEVFGIRVKLAKCASGNSLTFLGIMGHFPSPFNSFSMSASLPADKALKWSALIRSFLSPPAIIWRKDLESLIGRLSFAQCAVFGRVARSMLRPLYKHLYSSPSKIILSKDAVLALRWWAALLDSFAPRVISRFPSSVSWILYSDAEGADFGRAACWLRPSSFPVDRSIFRLQVCAPSLSDISIFEDTNLIYALELFTAVSAVFGFRSSLKNANVVVFIDNDAADLALIKASSKAGAVHRLIRAFWELASTVPFSVWFERVPSKSNLADRPSRGREPLLPVTSRSALLTPLCLLEALKNH